MEIELSSYGFGTEALHFTLCWLKKYNFMEVLSQNIYFHEVCGPPFLETESQKRTFMGWEMGCRKDLKVDQLCANCVNKGH